LLYCRSSALREYLYDNCTEDEFNELVNAPSVGQQFQASIKGIKPFRRIA